MNTLIIEVRGGVVQEVYTNANDVHVMLVDWDSDDSPEQPFAGGKIHTVPLANLPTETVEAIAVLAS